MTPRFFEQHRADADFAPMVSAILIPQSYLTLEYILQRNAIFTEMTYSITAVTLKQTSIVHRTPVLLFGRRFMTAQFSLETMMAGKMLACLERNYEKGKGITIKGRDFYDLLWFMQLKIMPMEEKLAKDGRQSYNVQFTMELLGKKITEMKISDLAEDLLPLFEQRSFIKAWLEGFQENFLEYVKNYI